MFKCVKITKSFSIEKLSKSVLYNYLSNSFEITNYNKLFAYLTQTSRQSQNLTSGNITLSIYFQLCRVHKTDKFLEF